MQLRVRTIAIVIILTVGICVPVAAENAPAVVPPPKSCTALATTGSDAADSAEKDADLQFRLELPWENYLISAPTAIFLLAQLTVLSGAGDFAMTSLMNGKAQFVRYPESFSASLVQVSNEGWSAFNTAHRNMDSIQMYTYQIPRTVNNALRVIATAPISMPSATRNKFLRVHLSSMVDYSKQCVALAQATELKFKFVMDLMGELLAGTSASKGEYEEKLRETLMEAEAAKAQRDHVAAMTAKVNEFQKQINDAVIRAEDQYSRAMSEIPTGWDEIFQKVGNTFTDIASSVASRGVMGLLTGGIGIPGIGGGDLGDLSSLGSSVAKKFGRQNALSIGGRLSNALNGMTGLVSTVSNGKAVKETIDKISGFGGVVTAFGKMLGSSGDAASQKLRGLLDRAGAVGKSLREAMSSASNASQPTIGADVVGEIDALLNEAKAFEAASAADGKLPQTPNSNLGNGGAFSGMSGNARFKAYVSLERLRDARQQQMEVFQESLKLMREMNELVGRIARLDMEKLNFEEKVKLIKEGILMLAKIREQWTILIAFFMQIATQSENAVALIGRFDKTAFIFSDDGPMSPEAQLQMRKFQLSELISLAKEIYRSAIFLNSVSKMYVSISSRYLLGPLAGMAALIVLPAEQRQPKLVQLALQSEAAQEEIKNAVRQKQAEHTNTIEAKIAAAQCVMNQLGGPSDSDVAALEMASGEDFANRPTPGDDA
ncbi:hypothetical protein BV898_13925 [Hypsibius exemplaris]|uniref:Uncharacterized protein n=1 Tax=Hypsibius exemplaris TaxID=2072580 RepID=A0A1W0W9F1_HYPEX|nr:hypothetical protein BV898_13925 [Hypsibius exemplaris]